MINLLRFCLIAGLLLSGCGWNGTPTRSNDFVPLTSIELVAVSSTIAVKTSTKLVVRGNYSGLFTRDITDQAVLTSDAPAVAGFITAAETGRVSGLVPGTATLTAKVGSVTSTLLLTVSPAVISTVTITPLGPAVARGLTAQLKATGTFSDATIQDLTFDAAWQSSAPDVATVGDSAGSKGLVRALAIGAATVTATFDGVGDTTLLTVTAPSLQAITLSPANPTALSLTSKTFKATGTYSDGSTSDVTADAVWSSSSTACATTAGAVVTALTQGSTTISAVVGTVTGSTGLTVTGGNLSSISVTPATVTLAKDTRARVKAVGTFTYGSASSSRDITGAVTWTTADSALAGAVSGGGNLEWLTAAAVTSGTVITATAPTGKTGTATVKVTSPTLSSINFSSTTVNVSAGVSAPLTVTASYSDDSTQDVTALSTWSSNDTSKATVAAGPLGTERITGVAAGTTTVSASFGGKTVTTPATVTVSQRTIQSLAISGTTTVAAGNQISLTATATYVDGTVDVTQMAVWSIDAAEVAVTADSQNQPGEIVAVGSGSATVTAVFDGKTATAKITVP